MGNSIPQTDDFEHSTDSCVFCNLKEMKGEILLETENFLVGVGIGIITAGHMMIITKKHFKCLAELPDELLEEYSELKEKLKKFISEKFSTPLLVEYGIWGQSVHHAHIHFIPLKSLEYEINDYLGELTELISVPFIVGDQNKLREIYQEEGVYVNLEENGELFIFDVSGLPQTKKKSFLDYRTFFAEKGISGVRNYNDLTDEEKLKDQEKRRITKEVFSEFK